MKRERLQALNGFLRSYDDPPLEGRVEEILAELSAEMAAIQVARDMQFDEAVQKAIQDYLTKSSYE